MPSLAGWVVECFHIPLILTAALCHLAVLVTYMFCVKVFLERCNFCNRGHCWESRFLSSRIKTCFKHRVEALFTFYFDLKSRQKSSIVTCLQDTKICVFEWIHCALGAPMGTPPKVGMQEVAIAFVEWVPQSLRISLKHGPAGGICRCVGYVRKGMYIHVTIYNHDPLLLIGNLEI